MINDDIEHFMSAVQMRAADWKQKSFEDCMNSFLSKTIKESTVIKLPESASPETKTNVFKEVQASVKESAKKLINNSLANEDSAIHNVDIANEIVNPKDLNESVQKLLAEHICNEAEDRSNVLKAQFEIGKCSKMTSEETLQFIEQSFEGTSFDNRFENGENLKAQLNLLLSTEGADLVDSIKQDVATLVNETEAKNSVIREAVSEINDMKSKIEEKINGQADPVNGTNDEDKKVGKDGDIAKQTEDVENDNTTVTGDSASDAQATEGFYDIAKKHSKSYSLSREDLYTVNDNFGIVADKSTESLDTTYDETSFSRQSAEDILSEFRELDDNIDVDTVPENEKTMSTSDGEEEADKTKNSDDETESQEMTYEDDDGNTIDVDNSKFEYDEEIKSEPLSEESMAKDFMPLSFKKMCARSVKASNKFPAYLALSSDHGAQFFDSIARRSTEMYNMVLSSEGAVCDSMSNDEINKKIETRMNECQDIKKDTELLVEEMGILGILDGQYQRTNDPMQNAVNSIFKPQILKQKDLASKEDLHEHELAEILKIGLEIADIKKEILDGANVLTNKDKLGYLEELLNEKMFELEPGEKGQIEEKVKALQSIESLIPVQEIVNIQYYKSKDDKDGRIKIESLKDIDAYGYKYADEIDSIKKSIREKYSQLFGDKLNSMHFDVDSIVECVAEEQDTTKFDTNLFEKVLAKCTENIEVTNSTEGLVVLNKARVLTTAFVTADKLGLLSKEDINEIKLSVM